MGNKRLFGRRKVMAGAAAATGLTIWSQRLSAQSGEVAVGAMVPITGPFNVSGQQYHFSLQMVQDEINAKGGVAGKKLKFVFEDVKDSNSVAVNAYLKVVRDIDPPLVFLSSYTTQNLATEPEVTKAQIPGMYAGGGDAMHLKKNPWLFRIRPHDGLQALALAKHATEGMGKKKIGIIYVQNDFGQPGAVAAEKVIKAAGAEVVGMEAYAFTDNDMSAQLQKLKNAGADCLICISYGKDGALVLKLMKEMGIDLPVVISSGVMVPAARNLIAPDEPAHVNGVKDETKISPDAYHFDQLFLDRPGNDAIQVNLLHNYQTNLGLYDGWHAYFKKHQPRMLITWGTNDVFFPVPGAKAYLRDLPKAELHLIETGHFALEDNCAFIAERIKKFFA